jgi:hypothetical protein
MTKNTSNPKLQEIWDRLVLLLIVQPREGWEHEFREISRREIERLAAYDNERGSDG